MIIPSKFKKGLKSFAGLHGRWEVKPLDAEWREAAELSIQTLIGSPGVNENGEKGGWSRS